MAAKTHRYRVTYALEGLDGTARDSGDMVISARDGTDAAHRFECGHVEDDEITARLIVQPEGR